MEKLKKTKNNVKDKNKNVNKEATQSTSESSSIEKTAESISEKSVESPKSASQRSISHFSSISSKEYRSGWTKIFGKKKKN
tara:strand:+ start:239 stop:481 length:243 start_codon:yes stop_codon:yes gene_type:complete